MQSAAGEVAEEIITATEELIKTGLEVCSESLVITEVGNLSVRLRQHALITRRGARLDRQSPGDLQRAGGLLRVDLCVVHAEPVAADIPAVLAWEGRGTQGRVGQTQGARRS